MGAIGMGNITFVSVTEHGTEIGFRRSLGVAPANVSKRSSMGRSLVGAVGGVVGTFPGVRAGLLIRRRS
jgi:ABC-type antimicrobial peptide transport system permease subunit